MINNLREVIHHIRYYSWSKIIGFGIMYLFLMSIAGFTIGVL